MLGIIGGSGLYMGLEGMSGSQGGRAATEFGEVEYTTGSLDGVDVVFMSRHRSQGRLVPPHLIPHRANIMALRNLGVKGVLSTATVGALDEDLAPGSLLVPDQYIDMGGQVHTFHDGGERGLLHMDMTEPFCPSMRALLLGSAKSANLQVRDGGTYASVPGPQFETAAEARMLRSLGGTVAGMTVPPEAKLCRELGICYGAVNLVVNATGDPREHLTHQNTVAVMETNIPLMARLIGEAVNGYASREGCGCPSLPRPFGD